MQYVFHVETEAGVEGGSLEKGRTFGMLGDVVSSLTHTVVLWED